MSIKIFNFSIALILFGVFFYAPKVDALSGSDFNAGNIIDDAIFMNKDSMTVAQIQAFLDSKVPVCDRNRPTYNDNHPPPYTCLNEFIQNPTTGENNYGKFEPNGNPSPVTGGKTAAEIIWQAGQDYDINPQALIVLLQKEQGLVTDVWPWSSQYSKATGYYCPDTAPCDPSRADFSKQVSGAAFQFRRYIDNIDNYWYQIGTNQILYNPNTACGRKTVNIENASTVALYLYTPYTPNAAALANLTGTGDSCSAYGNRNFWRYFNDWFGSTHHQNPSCEAAISGIRCVRSFMQLDGTQFLTTSQSEANFIATTLGWQDDGAAFYAASSQTAGTVPVYRLRNNNRYIFTASQTEYTTLKSSPSWVDEGIAFYAYPSTASSSVSHPVFRLTNATTGQNKWTSDAGKKAALLAEGYTLSSDSFNSLSNKIAVPTPATGKKNIYRLQGSNGYKYTNSLKTLEADLKAGFNYEGLLATSDELNTGAPVHQLRKTNGGRFYTSNLAEKNSAVSLYGMKDEGIAFHIDPSSDKIYRLSNSSTNRHFYTSNLQEAMSVININGWKYEGQMVDENAATLPVYRLLNKLNNRHFYTSNLHEAMKINNTIWQYENVAFSANKATGMPVYRLRLNDKFLYTNSIHERDLAVSKFNYTFEEIAYYVSGSVTTKPVYRLRNPNGAYFFTLSSTERASAVSKFNFIDEGIAFYLQP